jgi:hypothetical protein
MKRRVCTWVSMDDLMTLHDRWGVVIDPDFAEGISYAEHDGRFYAARMTTEETP